MSFIDIHFQQYDRYYLRVHSDRTFAALRCEGIGNINTNQVEEPEPLEYFMSWAEEILEEEHND